MRRLNRQAGVRQILPMLAAMSVLTGSYCNAQEKFPNELNSPIDEPLVVIPENLSRVPVRTISAEVEQSTDPLVRLAYETRESQRRRLLSTDQHTPWQMMHGLLGLRQDFLISHNGQTVSGLEWIKSGPLYQNEPWFQKTSHGGQAHPFNKPYWFEGHINQFLAILAMCNVPLDTEFGTPKGPITMRDMLKNAQMTANEKEEVTWTLWALTTYLPSDAEWVNNKGEKWSIERLVRLEVGKQVGGPTSPCGGTHGLFALARARNVYLRSGKPLRGVWLEAEQKIQKYIETARVNQNANGTLSSNFFRGKEYKEDFDKRMASSGHVLEFLMMALPQERLKEPWVRRAIEATANDLMANRKAYVSCSPLYHATDALSIYLDRVLPAPQQAATAKPGTVSISNTRTLTPAPVLPAPSPPAVSTTPEKSKDAEAAPAVATPAMPPGSSETPGQTAEKTNPITQVPLPDPAAMPVEPGTPAPASPAPASPAPASPAPATPAPASPAPASPAPASPAPASPAPASPAPASPAPASPAPASPAPASPAPASPAPASPAPATPAPASPAPASPAPATPAPATPAPATPANVDPLRPPAEPTPESPVPQGSAGSLPLSVKVDSGSGTPAAPVANAGILKSNPTRTVVSRAPAQGVSATGPVISGEKLGIVAGRAETVAVMLNPTPLVRVPEEPKPEAESTAVKVHSVPADEPHPGSSPRRAAEWKGTPAERRRPIVMEDAPRV